MARNGILAIMLLLVAALTSVMGQDSPPAAYGGSPRLNRDLINFQVLAQRKIRVVVVNQYRITSFGGYSGSRIYAFVRPQASEGEILHEVIHSVLELKGFAWVRPKVQSKLTRPRDEDHLAGNLNDYLQHPTIRCWISSLGYELNLRTLHAETLATVRKFPEGAESAENRISMATLAVGIAGEYEDAPEFSAELKKEVHRALPTVEKIASDLRKQFPSTSEVMNRDSRKRMEDILHFLDVRTAHLHGPAPSTLLRVVDGNTEPTISDQRELELKKLFNIDQPPSHNGSKVRFPSRKQ